MFPIRDHNPSHKFPFTTISIVIITSIVFFLEITAPDFETFITQFAVTPVNVSLGNISSLLPFIYSMFLHAGWFHIISNMWFLWIFGDNVEALLGDLGFLAFYLISGLGAGLLQYVINPTSSIPMLGASGAIAGVLGAYIIMYPNHKIDTLVPGFAGFMHRVELPASIMLGYWFVIQIFSGLGSLATSFEGGVAWWAHIGGFVTGVILIKIIPHKER